MSSSDKVICPICGNEIDAGAEFCRNCGSPMDSATTEEDSDRLEYSLASLEEMVGDDPDAVSVCPQCGDFTRPTDLKCSTCGYILREPSRASPEKADRSAEGGSIADAMFLCPECGAFLSEGVSVCDICGASLSVEKRIGVGDFKADAEGRPCPDCGAYLEEDTGECPICFDRPSKEPEEPPAEDIDVEDDINSFLEELEATEATEIIEEATVEIEVDKVLEETAIGSDEPPVPAIPEVKRPERPEPSAAERPAEAPVRVTKPQPIPRVLPPGRLVQRRRTQIQRLQEFLAYSSLVAIAIYYVSSQAGAQLIHWIMLGVFGVMFWAGLVISLLNIPRNWRWAFLRSIPFIIGAMIVIIVPVLHLMSIRDVVDTLGLPLVVAGGLISFAGIVTMKRDFFIFLIWSTAMFVVFLMCLSALELPGTWGMNAYTAISLWAFGFLYLVLSVGLLTRMKWIRVLIDTEILAGDRKYRQRRFKESIASYDKAINASTSLKSSLATSDNMDIPWYSKGAALTILGKYEEAIECIDNALKLSPNNEVALVNKGMALSRLGRHKEALKCYNEAIDVNPNYEVAWNNKGNALTRLHRYEKAIKCYDRAIQIDEEYREAWVNKGYALAKMGDYDGAARCADFVSRFSTSPPTGTGEKLIS